MHTYSHPLLLCRYDPHLHVGRRPATIFRVRLPEQKRLHPRHNLRVVLVALLSLVEQLQVQDGKT